MTKNKGGSKSNRSARSKTNSNADNNTPRTYK